MYRTPIRQGTDLQREKPQAAERLGRSCFYCRALKTGQMLRNPGAESEQALLRVAIVSHGWCATYWLSAFAQNGFVFGRKTLRATTAPLRKKYQRSWGAKPHYSSVKAHGVFRVEVRKCQGRLAPPGPSAKPPREQPENSESEQAQGGRLRVSDHFVGVFAIRSDCPESRNHEGAGLGSVVR